MKRNKVILSLFYLTSSVSTDHYAFKVILGLRFEVGDRSAFSVSMDLLRKIMTDRTST